MRQRGDFPSEIHVVNLVLALLWIIGYQHPGDLVGQRDPAMRIITAHRIWNPGIG